MASELLCRVDLHRKCRIETQRRAATFLRAGLAKQTTLQLILEYPEVMDWEADRLKTKLACAQQFVKGAMHLGWCVLMLQSAPGRGSQVSVACLYCPPSSWQVSARGVVRCSSSFAKRRYGLR